MSFFIILNTLHFRKFAYQMLVCHGSIIFALRNYFIQAVAPQNVVKSDYQIRFCLSGLESFLCIAVKNACMSALFFCQLHKDSPLLFSLHDFCQSLIHKHSIQLALLAAQYFFLLLLCHFYVCFQV